MITREEHADDYVYLTATNTGESHLSRGLCNQDASCYMHSSNGFALAVADGVGSCAKADVGAKAACSAVVDSFSLIEDDLLELSSTSVTDAIIVRWRGMLLNERLSDCCSTLKAAIGWGSRLLLLSLGDGLIAVSSGEYGVVSPADVGLFANQTNCLSADTTPADFWSETTILESKAGFALFMCTDGVSSQLKDGVELDLVREIERYGTPTVIRSEIEDLVKLVSDYNNDDKTVGIVWRGGRHA